MDEESLQQLLAKLDGRGSDEEYDALDALRKEANDLPKLLLERYRVARKWGERASCVYHSVKYAKTNNSAFQIGIEAIRDKSAKVRYRACMLLAVAQRQEALASLEELLKNPASKEDAAAAIDAINGKNQDLFVDRKHTGKIQLKVPQVHS